MHITPLVDSFSDELFKIADRTARSKEDSSKNKLVRGAAGALAPVALSDALAGMSTGSDHSMASGPDAVHQAFLKTQKGMGLANTPTHMITAPSAEAAMGHSAPKELYRQANMEVPKHWPFPDAHVENLKGSKKYLQEGAGQFVRLPHQVGEEVLAHELGHVANHSKLGPKFSTAAGLSSMGILGPSIRGRRIPLLPAATGAMAATQEEPSWAPGLVNAAVAAPMLADEGMASARSLKYMTKQHGLGKGLAKSIGRAPALGSYAALGLAPLAITAGRKLYRRAKEKKAGAGMTGAAIGGLIGGGVGGLKGGVVGAALGGLAGKATHKFNEMFIEEPGHRRQMLAQMPSQDYTPSWAQDPRR